MASEECDLEEFEIINEFDNSFDEFNPENENITNELKQNDVTEEYLNETNKINGENWDKNLEPAEELKLRNYQEELAAPALKGDNTIVCAPTGSGKTIVAVKIIADHLSARKSNVSGESAKVAFLVPTVNLVDQQQDVLQRYMRGQFKISGLKGGQKGLNKVPKVVVVQHSDIVVMTPQLLWNMLTDKDDILSLKMTDFSLFVFDECHHADKSHSYNELMNLYFDIKFDNTRSSDEILPQIVGLTASLGVGQGDSAVMACDHIFKICANLDIKKLALVERNKEELKIFVYAPKDEPVIVKFDPYEDTFSKRIITMMMSVENELIPIFDHITEMRIKHDSLTFQPPEKRWSAVYTSWIYGWYHFAPTLKNAEFKRQLTTYVEHLIIYHNTLEINIHVPTKYAFRYLSDNFEKLNRKKTTPLDERLCSELEEFLSTFNNSKVPNPLVNKLKEILLEQYKAKEDSRTLIFVRTRGLVNAVERYLNNDNELLFLKAGSLTGVNAKKKEGGQTEREQQEVLERFKKGEHKIIVATTVAEEGLDIEKCNLVIKYNHVTNEIAMVQRRGRGRAVGSKSILLTHEDWIEEKETVNLMREKLMHHALEVIRQKGEIEFANEIERRQKKAYRSRVLEKIQRELMKKKLGNKIFAIKCKKCDKPLTDSTKIRCIENQHIVCIDPRVWDSLWVEPRNSPKLYESLSVAGRVSCRECRTGNGTVIKYKKVYLPTLKSESLAFISCETDEIKYLKQWKQVQTSLFVVEPLQDYELFPMCHALQQECRERLDKALKEFEAA